MAQNTTQARTRHRPGVPSPANKTRRLYHHQAFRTVSLGEKIAVRATVAGYYAKRPHKILPVAWRNKDRTHLAGAGLFLTTVWLLTSPWLAILLAIPTGIVAFVGWDRHRARSEHGRTTRREDARLGKTVIYKPTVLDHRDCLAPAKPTLPRSDRIKIGGAEIIHPKAAAFLDKVKPLENRPPLVARYCHLKYSPHIDPDDYRAMTETIANTLEQPVTFTRNRLTPGYGTMRVQYIDWLARIAPWQRDGNLTPMRIPVGQDWDARTVHDSIHDQAWLIGGVRGAGKTAFLRGILGRLWDLPNVELWLCDHADDLVDFHPYARRVASTPEDAVELSADFVELHYKQRAEMVADGRKFVTWPDYPCRIFVVDELAGLTTHKQHGETFSRNLMLMATQGRKTAHSLLAATQQPNATVIPTAVRGQFTRRLGLRVENRSDVEMIMGSADYDLRGIPPQHPGRGAWKGVGAAIPVRTFGLFDHDLSWLFRDNNRQQPMADDRPSPSTADNQPPPTPLFAVPDADVTNEDLFRRALAGAPSTGLDLSTIARQTGIPLRTLYRYVNLPGVEQVRSVKPRTYRLRERRSA